ILNADQERVFQRVLKDVYTKDKTKPLVLYVGGAAGTGKSELIRRLVQHLGYQHVIVCGSTAMASKNIDGVTAHSVLFLNPFSEEKDDEPLPPHPHLLLFIVDEISMCDATLFRRIEKRLRQLMRKDVVFGGCTVLLFGDLLQIPPVSRITSGSCFDEDGINWIFKSSLWEKEVQYDELEIPMRQENDPEFAEMLKRWRVGICTEEDREFLDSNARKFTQEFTSDVVSEFDKYFKEDRSIMILAHTNPQVGGINKKITHKLIKRSQLFNVVKTTYTRRYKDAMSVQKRQVMFQVGVGSRVQITRNVDRHFINGETGVITKIETINYNVVSLEIRLDSSNEPRPFPSTKTQIGGGSNSQSWTEEFSIHSAYAVTYHKAQGQTLDDVFLATYRDMPPALFYVGASRVRTKEDLHILNWNAGDTIRADPEALDEYKRLRVSIGKPPLPL
ncbi:hypothetical protein CAEBREN_31941, partial [Caenorhabditis brenneri]